MQIYAMAESLLCRFIFGITSAIISAPKIRTQPAHILSERCSPKSSVLNRTPNTDSSERKSDASADGTKIHHGKNNARV